MGPHRWRSPAPACPEPDTAPAVRLRRALSFALLVLLALAAGNRAAHAQAGPAQAGVWSDTFAWPLVAVHAAVLPDGRVISWGGADDQVLAGGSEAHLWDPVGGSFTAVPNGTTNIFCGGHALASDGRLLVAGGHVSAQVGVPDLNLFDPATGAWSLWAPMNRGRWYPTVTPLPNGEALVIGGFATYTSKNNLPQVWLPGGGWRNLTNASLEIPLYPWMFVAPDGRVYMAGPNRGTRFLSTSGAGRWKRGPGSLFGVRVDGSAAMYDEGKILIAGGGRKTATRTAEVIDLTAATPRWRAVGSMAFARRHFNLTLLPDGTVLATGGTTIKNDTTKAILPAEIFDPETQTWRTVAPLAVRRMYHSVAALLPDGRVLVAGGGAANKGDTDHPDAQVYSPPYLFASDGSPAVRPLLEQAPAEVRYGETFLAGTPDAGRIARVNWIRLSSVTHSFNENQRLNRLVFSSSTGGLNVTAPSGANLAPPGHYLLFLIDGDGVPSEGKVVRLRP